MKNNLCIVGGGFTPKKESSIINKLHFALSRFYNCDKFNGILPESIKKYDLTLWMPDFSNEVEKDYPIKKKGSVLICSKVMRYGYTKGEAISRIFKMHGNAVIAIYKKDGYFTFELIDALGNTWIETENLDELSIKIIELYHWTNSSIRISLTNKEECVEYETESLNSLLRINNTLSDKVVKNMGERFFGNLSCRAIEKTRCMKLFVSKRDNDGYLISPRNSNKEYLTPEEFVYVDSSYNYYGNRKPSVDSPVQIAIYKLFYDINYMIHGHCFIKNAVSTKEYYPCGDCRELPEIFSLLYNNEKVINLKNHGFLIVSSTIAEMENIINNIEL